MKIVGSRPIRPDGAEKTTGHALFGADVSLPGMLVGALKRSPYAHARIRRIETRKALSLEGVKALITGDDLRQYRGWNAGEEVDADAEALHYVSLNCMAHDRVLYVGHVVAAVAAVSESVAEAAIQLIEVDYDILPHAIDIDTALAPQAPSLYPERAPLVDSAGRELPLNIVEQIEISQGDVAAAFDAVDIVVKGRFRTRPVHQGYIEPHACVASTSGSGQHQIWSSTQGQFFVRYICAKVLGLDVGDIRVWPSEIGGGFGGKTSVYLEPLALALSIMAGRPVQMVMSRADVFEGTGPAAASLIDIQMGAMADGRIIAAEVVLHYEAGAFPGAPIGAGCMSALACYKIEKFLVKGFGVVCNRPRVAAYRAPGAPMAAFAVESCLDMIAEELRIDPIDLRIANAVTSGSEMAYGERLPDVALLDALKAIRSHPHYTSPLAPNSGRGVACGFWFNGGGESSAAIRIDEDGGVSVLSSSPDIGGSRASLAMIAADTIGVDYKSIRISIADTASISYAALTGSSRVTFSTGIAVAQAAEQVINGLRQRAARIWGCAPELVVWRDGEAVLTSSPANASLSIREIMSQTTKIEGAVAAESTLVARGAAPAFAVHLCDVTVDLETGLSRVTRYTAAQDVGRAIHPAYVEGQIQGGVAQGIGWALNEAYVYDQDGALQNASFQDYRMPISSDLPMIDTVLIETAPNRAHPFGAKGVGEVPIVPPLAAVATAISRAVGVRVTELPLCPERVFTYLILRGNHDVDTRVSVVRKLGR